MIIPFVFTLDTVCNGCQLMWVFNKSVSFSKEYGWPVIAQKQYFDHYGENSSVEDAEYYDYDAPQLMFLKKITPIVIPTEIEDEFITKFPSQIDAYLASVKYEWKEMTDFLSHTVQNLEKQYGEKVEAIVSMRYYCFLNDFCKQNGIQILYYEWGPFRTPNYRNTAHLDFYGLQSNSSIGKNYNLFREKVKESKIPILSAKEILSIFLNIDYLEYIWQEEPIPEYEIGIAAGYTTPGVITPYNAITLDELVYQCRKMFQPSKIGIRLHPGDPLRTQPAYGNIDNGSLIDFIFKSKRIACSGSNIAYEAALYGRPTYEMGGGQFSFAVNTSLKELSDKIPSDELLSFVAFGALIPYELLNCVEYLRFRLRKPEIAEIYLYHLAYYLESFGADMSILNEHNVAEKICELRLKEENILSISPEFQKYYLYSGLELRYRKLSNYLKKLEFQISKQNNIYNDEVRKKEEEIINLNAKICDMHLKVQQIEMEKQNIANDLQIISDSTLYKATKPLRDVLDFIKKILKSIAI